MTDDFKKFQEARKVDKVKYFVQYFSTTTLTWQEVRKTFKTKAEAENVAYSYGDIKTRVVEYINGNRSYFPINN